MTNALVLDFELLVPCPKIRVQSYTSASQFINSTGGLFDLGIIPC